MRLNKLLFIVSKIKVDKNEISKKMSTIFMNSENSKTSGKNRSTKT